MNEAINYKKVCDLDDIWEGEMEVYKVDGQDVLIVHAPGGEVRAYDPICPHQNHPLIEGILEGCVLTCSAHLWEFDVVTGKGINPDDTALNAYPIKTEDEAVWVAIPSKN